MKQLSRLIAAALILIALLLALNVYKTRTDSAETSSVRNETSGQASVKDKSGNEKSTKNKKAKETAAKNKTAEIAEEKLLDISLINQMDAPRLYNGCEITSLAMLLQDNGYHVTKNELADQVKSVPLTYENGQHGNPNVGFVGDMENGPGLGVYHGPVYELAQKYAENNVKDITNQSFSEVIKNISAGHPVWVIINTQFAPVSNFQTWDTPQGTIKITYSEHSVVVTGYDENNIYVNDPYGTKNKQLDREKFIKAWEQMGSQAIVIQ